MPNKIHNRINSNNFNNYYKALAHNKHLKTTLSKTNYNNYYKDQILKILKQPQPQLKQLNQIYNKSNNSYNQAK